MVIGLIRGLIVPDGMVEDEEPAKLLEEQLELRSVKANATTEEERWELCWLLCAQAAFGTSTNEAGVLRAVHFEDPNVVHAAARALRSIGWDWRTGAAIGHLFRRKESRVQAEAARSHVSQEAAERLAELVDRTESIAARVTEPWERHVERLEALHDRVERNVRGAERRSAREAFRDLFRRG